MNKTELLDAVAEKVGDRKAAATTLEAVLDVVMSTVAGGEKVALSGFGVFEKADRAARTARNPATGETVQVAAASVPRFRPGQGFKTTVGGARAAAETSPAPSAGTRAATAARSAPATVVAEPVAAVEPPAAKKKDKEAAGKKDKKAKAGSSSSKDSGKKGKKAKSG